MLLIAMDAWGKFFKKTFAHRQVLLVIGKRQRRKIKREYKVALFRLAMGTRVEVGD